MLLGFLVLRDTGLPGYCVLNHLALLPSPAPFTWWWPEAGKDSAVTPRLVGLPMPGWTSSHAYWNHSLCCTSKHMADITIPFTNSFLHSIYPFLFTLLFVVSSLKCKLHVDRNISLWFTANLKCLESAWHSINRHSVNRHSVIIVP